MSTTPQDLHQLLDVLRPSGWKPRASGLGLWRPVAPSSGQFITALGAGRVEIWGFELGGVMGSVMEIPEVPEFLRRRLVR